MTWRPDPTTTTSTVPDTTVPETTVPETTIPVTTLPNGCGEGFDIPCPPEGCTITDTDIVCVPPPATTIPVETTSPPTIGDVCHINGSTDIITRPDFQFYNSSNEPGAIGTHSISALPCGPVVAETTTTVAVAEPVPTLPATGGEAGWIALTGTVMILTGISLVSMVKGRKA
jgi:hypothetical protein